MSSHSASHHLHHELESAHQKRPAKRVSSEGRSVKDYLSEEEIRQALISVLTLQEDGSIDPRSLENNPAADWILPVPDPAAEKQTVDDELQRLLALKSYLVLDAEKERAFDQLTEEACQFYQVPTSLITLIDLGRQFLLSNTGNPSSARETPRRVAFCAHAILHPRQVVMVVKDTQDDDRFRDNVLVTQAPHLRFYAGAPLVSPEGYRLGTFCIEGPEPRPHGLSPAEEQKLKEFAQKAMDLMVQRRDAWQQHVQRNMLLQSSTTLTHLEQLRRHAGVATNLGGILYRYGDCLTAMRLYQESVQTLMHLEGDATYHQDDSHMPSRERQEEMSQLLNLLSSETITKESQQLLLDKVTSLFDRRNNDGNGVMAAPAACHSCTVDGIPGLFSATSKLKGSLRRHLVGLIFGEAFQIAMESTPSEPIDPRQFIIPLEQCSKATLFNMGLIHYHWGSTDSAMQFFDLAASLSNVQTALCFDPVVLGCRNNMAQIHLQYGRHQDAMEMLSDALTRGNAALAAMYGDDHQQQEKLMERTRRLRRKLARTVMNMGHVHFFHCDYASAMTTCNDALRLLHTNMEEMEVAAVWYNVGLLHYHQGNRMQALSYFDKFMDLANRLECPHQLQIAEALYKKGQILFEMGNLSESIKPLNEALRIRSSHLRTNHEAVAETLCLLGKVLQAREEYDFALNALERGLAVQRSLSCREDLSLDCAQTLLEVARAHHAQGHMRESLQVYTKVCDLTKSFFGEHHLFVARISNIVGNLHLELGDVPQAVRNFEAALRIQLAAGLPGDLNVVKDPLFRAKVSREPQAGAA